MPDDQGRFRVAIVGSRDYTPDDEVFAAIERMRKRHPEGLVVITGDARGVDTVAWQIAAMLQVPYVREEANWPPPDAPLREKYLAGSERNGRVVDQSDALIAFFHPGPASDLSMTSSGTVNAFRQALSKGIPTFAFHEGKWTTGALPNSPTLPPDGWRIPKGYRASSTTSTCGSPHRVGCGATILWSETARGRRIPLNPDGSSHLDSCPIRVKEHRGA